MKSKFWPYVENITEAGCACLITMVQGNLIVMGAAHWIAASQTGLIAGVIAGTTILVAKLSKRWVISLTLGIVTATVDFYVHPGNFGTMVIAEALVTGIGAALLSYLAGLLFMARKKITVRGRDKSVGQV